MVAWLIPLMRQTSTTVPASTGYKAKTICPRVDLDVFICHRPSIIGEHSRKALIRTGV